MNKFLKYTGISVILVIVALFIFTATNKYRINILRDEIDCTIIAKGCRYAKAITIGENGYIYIAYKNYIKAIDSNGKEEVTYKDENLDIEDIEYVNGNIYIISKDTMQILYLEDKNIEIALFNIAQGNIGINRRLANIDDKLFLSIPSKTNSGVLDGLTEQLAYDNNIGNAAIYEIDIDKNEVKLYANGIRGINGIDYDSKGNIVAIFTGMKDEGERAVKRDRDYLYYVKKGQWYGWPDFSGGDNITSPRFKGEEDIGTLIKNPPQKIVLAPIYQYEYVDALKELAIDRDGTILNENSIIISDKKNKLIKVLDSKGFLYSILKLNSHSNIVDIVYSGDEFLILDSSIGCLYSIHKKDGFLGFRLPSIVLEVILAISFLLLILVVYKLSKKKVN